MATSADEGAGLVLRAEHLWARFDGEGFILAMPTIAAEFRVGAGVVETLLAASGPTPLADLPCTAEAAEQLLARGLLRPAATSDTAGAWATPNRKPADLQCF